GNREKPEEVKSEILSVYPNPSSNSIIIKGVEENDVLTIYDLMGKVIKRTKLTTNNESLIISDMASGLYILSVFGKDKVQFVKN
ncbi:T9SS type A sorting domain-containing protein, partial [uncultured Aquimarina sp.]|uniref:T9SS type A sorting domain-containing protein n=1 Tax=uncultured Aquimarina sp. TaxID=575652 RepID=UPI00260BDB44